MLHNRDLKSKGRKQKLTHYFCNGKDLDRRDPKTAKSKRKAEKIGLPFVMVNRLLLVGFLADKSRYVQIVGARLHHRSLQFIGRSLN